MKTSLVAILLVLTGILVDYIATVNGLPGGLLQTPRITYTREALLSLKRTSLRVPNELFLPSAVCRKQGNGKIRKRGRKGGLRTRLRRKPFRQPLPSIMLGNVRSIRNKMDELRASVQYLSDYRQSCLICLSETWLAETDPESAIDLEGFSVVRADRTASSGKSKGGGLCMFINNKYCSPSHVTVRNRLCTKDIELLAVNLRPYYLPREINQAGPCCANAETDSQSDTGENDKTGGHNSNSTDQGTTSTDQGGGHGSLNIDTLPIVTWKWSHVQTPYFVALWILVSWLCKLVFELNHHVTSVLPESALLILIGFVLGGIVWAADHIQKFTLTPTIFFFYLLPQIILDAGYFMPNKLFFSNLGTILIFAIIGTCWNAAAVGLSLWGCHQGGAMGDLNIGLIEFLLFGSLIAAVDPVAVIAVFEEVHVNEVLFILVFGESLLNDGVTVVLYNVFDAYVSLGVEKINAVEIIKGITSFFVVAFGGALVGVVFAILLCLVTRFTKNIQIIEAGFIFVFGYLSYLTAEMLSLSAILSVTFCGVCCQKYINANMHEKSVVTVRYVMKVIANGSETMIFVFLGVTAIDQLIWEWNTGFILLTLLFVLIYRFIGVFFLTWLLNKNRLVPIEFIDQVVIAYGGLRGAVAYGLAVMLDEKKIPKKHLLMSTTLIVIFFTVILQGITMKPLVQWLKVKRAANTEVKLVEKINSRAFDHTLCAIEDICGQIGDNWWTRGWKRFEEKYISWLLMKPKTRKSKDHLFNIFHKLNLEDAMNYITEGERKGSLAFLRNDDDAQVDFKKTYGKDIEDVMPDIEADMDHNNHVPMTSFIWDTEHSVSLDIHKQDLNGTREAEDLNAHNLLQQHLYRSRKHHRHKYSRSNFSINQNEDEVQEIFQRTMRSRLESFKSNKMKIAPGKIITKHPQKEQQQEMANGTSTDRIKSHPLGDEDFKFSVSEGESASGSEGAIGRECSFRLPPHTVRAGIENPAFMPEMDTPPPMRPLKELLNEPETDMTVAPSQRAQWHLPWTPSQMRRLAPLRISTRSDDSFAMANVIVPQDENPEDPPPHRDGSQM